MVAPEHESVMSKHSPNSLTFPTMKAPSILLCSHSDLGLFHTIVWIQLSQWSQPKFLSKEPPEPKVPHRGGNKKEKQKYFSMDPNPRKTLSLPNVQLTFFSTPSPCQMSHHPISRPLIKSSVLYPRDMLSSGLPFEEKNGMAAQMHFHEGYVELCHSRFLCKALREYWKAQNMSL